VILHVHGSTHTLQQKQQAAPRLLEPDSRLVEIMGFLGSGSSIEHHPPQLLNCSGLGVHLFSCPLTTEGDEW